MLWKHSNSIASNSRAFPIKDSDVEPPERIESKVKFLHLTNHDLEMIRRLQPLLQEVTPVITDQHYRMLGEFPELLSIIDQNTTIERLSGSFRRYLQSLATGELTEDYIAGREKIGVIHSKIGLAPEWYMGSYLRVYEHLVPAIVSAYAKRPAELSDALLALLKVITLDSQIVLESYQADNDFKVIDRLGNVLELVMQIDKIKHVLDRLGRTTDEAGNVSTAAEQLSLSVQKVAQSSAEVAENALSAMEQADRGKEIIASSLIGFLAMAEEFYETKAKIAQLQKSIDKVSQVVEMIRSIADQTNLLALNASIEAARAGEQGRGFAVVAGEVRKLAEQTKSSVQTITATIQNVQSDANLVGQTAERMTGQIDERVAHTREAIQLFNLIVESIKEVSRSTEHIAAIAEEQSAATSDITRRVSSVQENMELIAANVSTAGQNVYDIGVAVNELHKLSISQTSSLRDKHYLRIVKTDHLLWKWWLYNFMLGYHQIEENELVNHHQCRLGKWYDAAKENGSLGSLETFRKLEEPHRQFHELVRSIFFHVKEGRHQEAQAAFSRLEEVSEAVIRCLDELADSL
ncbi:protoglobin domain-containing protein [Brevibacillus sp. FSL L8-0520]|uniref:protoglobin domain-containing protein n=1 Tax=Brevibacillus TaxID=55080 RepID=UPI0030CC6FFA